MTDWTAATIFCDDIRMEFNGKVILIGIYQGALNSPIFPVPLTMSTYIDIRGLAEGRHTSSIRAEYVIGDEQENVASLESEIEVRDTSLPSVLYGNGMQFIASEPGNLNLWLGIDGEEPRLIDSLRVHSSSATVEDQQ